MRFSQGKVHVVAHDDASLGQEERADNRVETLQQGQRTLCNISACPPVNLKPWVVIGGFSKASKATDLRLRLQLLALA